jgi:hypothetical protein
MRALEWLAVGACLAIGIFCLIYAEKNSRFGRDWQREAILKGHAIWAVDKDGGPVFQWKPIGGER